MRDIGDIGDIRGIGGIRDIGVGEGDGGMGNVKCKMWDVECRM